MIHAIGFSPSTCTHWNNANGESWWSVLTVGIHFLELLHCFWHPLLSLAFLHQPTLPQLRLCLAQLTFLELTLSTATASTKQSVSLKKTVSIQWSSHSWFTTPTSLWAQVWTSVTPLPVHAYLLWIWVCRGMNDKVYATDITYSCLRLRHPNCYKQ